MSQSRELEAAFADAHELGKALQEVHQTREELLQKLALAEAQLLHLAAEVYIHMYTYIYVCECICVCMYEYTLLLRRSFGILRQRCTYMFIHIYTYIYECACVCMYVCIFAIAVVQFLHLAAEGDIHIHTYISI